MVKSRSEQGLLLTVKKRQHLRPEGRVLLEEEQSLRVSAVGLADHQEDVQGQPSLVSHLFGVSSMLRA